MNEDRHLSVLHPFPERKCVLAVEEPSVPARRDQEPLEAERPEAALALCNMALVEWIERAEPPVLRRTRYDPGNLIVDCLHDIDRRRLGRPGDGLRRERRAD